MLDFNRAAAAAVLGAVVVLTALPAQAGRSIRVDLPGGRPFEETGELWDNNTPVFFPSQPHNGGVMPFRTNFSGAPGSGSTYTFDFAISGGGNAYLQFGPSIDGNVIFPFYFFNPSGPTIIWDANDSFASSWSTGVVDTAGPYDLADAVEAIRFTWGGHLSTGGEVYAQLVFLDRSDTGTTGDFDIELNYGVGSYKFPSGGAQQVTIGPDALYGGITSGPLTAICFRDGVGTECAPDETPEPATSALLGLGLFAAGLPALRRRLRTR